MVDEATRQFGRIDILVNNAGIIAVGPLQSQTIEDFQQAMDIMFWGTVNTTLAALPAMIERGPRADCEHLFHWRKSKHSASAPVRLRQVRRDWFF